VAVAYLGADAKLAAIGLLNDLRAAGLRAVAPFGDRGLKAQFRFADRAEVKYTLVLGSDEVAQGTVAVRDMAASTQTTVPRTEIVQWLNGRLKTDD
jgi:histidyl-tRNA synthetase